jgi:predicted RNA binding protein YcfA (HicA-like mRNA interferase family)
MTRNLRNWNYRDVTRFLKEKGFELSHAMKGSHQAWVKLDENNEPQTFVEVSINQKGYPPKTLRTMILQSEISEDEWLNWSRS